mmetsp:Transcript_58892/g.140527  ORF Transcript_58892/g.140527 Transcript_58892/m.140527 type:complete len:388 (+) Transcript_58892:105-1268(+)
MLLALRWQLLLLFFPQVALTASLLGACFQHEDAVRDSQSQAALSLAQLRAQATAAPGKLCQRGKLLPELYLLGAQKCATTEFSVDLMSSGILSAAAQRTHTGLQKEWHFFEYWLGDHNHTWDSQTVERDWYNSLPDCGAYPSSVENRTILADMTPSNMRLVPLGDDMERSNPDAFGHTDVTEINLPVTLKAFYGALSSKVVFMSLLREPMSRMQSAWYHSQDWKAKTGRTLPGARGQSFHEDLQMSLQEAEHDRLTMLLWGSLYGRQLQRYLSEFAASQFILIPYRYYTHLAQQEVCAVVAKRLGHSLRCKPIKEGGWVPNSHKHPSLVDDVSAQLNERFERFIAHENELLQKVLLQANTEGATLPAFHPSGPATLEAVKDWLIAGW